MRASRIKLALGSLLLALAADMLNAPQVIPWILVALGGFLVIWGIWPRGVVRVALALPRGQVLAEKLQDFGTWIDGIASLTFDEDVASEFDRMHALGQEMLSRCPYLQTGNPNYSDLRRDWDTEVREWMRRTEEYISENISRAEAYMFRTMGRTRPRELNTELDRKIEKLRLITGRYLRRDDGTRQIS